MLTSIRSWVGTGALAAFFVLAGCGDDDDEPMATIDAGTSTLYSRLGEGAGIRTVITDFVGRVVADPKINGFFLNSSVDGGRLIDCLVKQVGNATGGPEVYPDPAGTPNGCRDMKSSHAGLAISTQDFNDLVGHLVAALSEAGVAQADIDAIAGVLGPMKGDIVEDEASNATVYQRVGRKPAIGVVVDDFIGRVVADASINGFFATTDAARLRTCLVRQVCSIDGPCEYGQEVDGAEPGVGVASPCKDMASSHAGLTDSEDSPITIEDWSALVGHLVAALDGAGVAMADKTAVLGALGPLCTDIVADAQSCGP
jgi:hemoglobin